MCMWWAIQSRMLSSIQTHPLKTEFFGLDGLFSTLITIPSVGLVMSLHPRWLPGLRESNRFTQAKPFVDSLSHSFIQLTFVLRMSPGTLTTRLPLPPWCVARPGKPMFICSYDRTIFPSDPLQAWRSNLVGVDRFSFEPVRWPESLRYPWPMDCGPGLGHSGIRFPYPVASC